MPKARSAITDLMWRSSYIDPELSANEQSLGKLGVLRQARDTKEKLFSAFLYPEVSLDFPSMSIRALEQALCSIFKAKTPLRPSLAISPCRPLLNTQRYPQQQQQHLYKSEWSSFKCYPRFALSTAPLDSKKTARCPLLESNQLSPHY